MAVSTPIHEPCPENRLQLSTQLSYLEEASLRLVGGLPWGAVTSLEEFILALS